MMREIPFQQASRGVLILALLLTAAGCAAKQAASPETPPATAAAAPPSGLALTPAPSAAAEASVSPTPTGTDKADASNAVQKAAAGDAPTPKSAPASKPHKTYEAYSAEKPLLVGTAIGDSKEKAVQLHGGPADSYVMEDENDPINVSEYDGFNIGFNKSQTVEFVEVTTGDVDTGLNGLRLGQTLENALNALGKPDASTDYVLNYRTKTTVLKLDIDPKNKTVESIKLFRRTE